MNALEKSPTILTEVGARRLTDRLRLTLTDAHEQLIDLWRGRAWEALGYKNWPAYCAGEFGDLLRVRLPAEQRRDAAEHMRAAGMSYRNMAAALGVNVATVHGDLNPKAEAPDPYDGMTRAVEALARVRAQGDRGLTSLELDAETGWPMGTATATLCRLERRGLVRRVSVFRRNRAAYVLSPDNT